MRGFRFFETGSGKVVDIPERPVEAGMVLVKVKYCGVCGTDMNIWRGTDRCVPGVVLGHEYCGTVVQVGEGVEDIKVGDRVAVDPNIPCGKCEACRKGRINLCSHLTALGVDIDGGFAEYSWVPEAQLFVLSPSMTWEEAALMEPLACALNGINRVNIALGDDVLVLGGGPMGLLMVQLAKLSGAGRVALCERMDTRRELGASFGADITVSDLNELNDFRPDVVLECIGNPLTQQAALDIVKPAGQVELFGDGDMTKSFSVSSQLFYQKELTAVGAALNPFTHSQAYKLIASGRMNLAPMVSGKISLDDLHDLLVKGYTGEDVKILVAFD